MKGIGQVIVALLVGGLFGVPPLFAQARPDWVGVWRLSFSETPESTGHWVISNQNGKVSVQQYGLAWRPEAMTVSKIDGNALSATHHVGGYKVLYSVTRQGDRFSGTAKLVHVQYSEEQRISGFRVIAVNRWDPLEGIRKITDSAGVADVSSALRKAALAKKLRDFTAAWDSEIGVPYYLFLDRFWDPDPVKRSERLRQLYQVLRSKQFAANVKTLLGLRAEALALVKAKQASFYFANPTILVPSLSSADVSLIDVLKGKVYVKMEVPDKLLSGTNLRLKWLIAREQVKMGFLVRFPLQVRVVPIELIREGISGYLAAELVGISLPELLGANPAKTKESLARLDTYRKAMASRGNIEMDKLALPSQAEPLARYQIVDMVGYKFGEQVLTRFKAEEVAKLDRSRLLELAKSYLQVGS